LLQIETTATKCEEREMNWTWFCRKGIDEEVDRTQGSKTLIDWVFHCFSLISNLANLGSLIIMFASFCQLGGDD
jgi:hypothetical protein